MASGSQIAEPVQQIDSLWFHHLTLIGRDSMFHLMLQRCTTLFFLSFSTSLLAQEEVTVPKVQHKAEESEAKIVSKKKPSNEIKKLPNGQFQLGQITFDAQSREISFPARVEQTRAIIEYVLVLSKGKIHESLFVTDITPSQLNIVLKLLNYKESKELFPDITEDQAGAQLHEVPLETRKQARLEVFVTLQNPLRTLALHELITHDHTKADMAPTDFVNSGSYLENGTYLADRNGDIIALLTDSAAMLNYPGEDRLDDTLWVPNTKRLPEYGSPVTITLKPSKRPIESP